jgi:hypothetical protein
MLGQLAEAVVNLEPVSDLQPLEELEDTVNSLDGIVQARLLQLEEPNGGTLFLATSWEELLIVDLEMALSPSRSPLPSVAHLSDLTL